MFDKCVDEVNVDETVETRQSIPLLLERAAEVAIKVSVACIEVNLRTEMIMRMGSFFCCTRRRYNQL